MEGLDKRIVVGFGTGRCRSRSLAAFLDQQNDITCTHERMIPFDPQWGNYIPSLDLLCRTDAPIVGNISAGWINYIDRLIMDIPDLKLILLDRADKEAVVKSFDSYLRKQLRGQQDLTSVYPIFDRRYTTGAIDAAVSRYIYKTVVLTRVYPDSILVVKTDRLNDRITQDRILQYIGIPVGDRIYGMPELNKRADMSHEAAIDVGVDAGMGKRVDL